LSFVTLKFALKTFVSNFLLPFNLGSKFFILRIGFCLFILELLSPVLQKLIRFSQHFDLDITDLNLDFQVLNALSESLSFFD
jgi:hypothetical protein